MSRDENFERRWNLRQVDAGVLEGDALAELVRLGTRVAQERASIKIDGLAGPATREAVLSLLGIEEERVKPPRKSRRKPPPDLIPVPTRRNIEAVYGNFSYAEDPSRPGAILIEKKWTRENIVKVHFGPGLKQYTWMHRLLAEEFPKVLERASEFSGYYPQKVWSWVPRHKRWDPKRGLSSHSWGIAVDIDPKLNAPGAVEKTKLYKYPTFLEVFRDAGWSCGYDWKDYPDAMHFERVRR